MSTSVGMALQKGTIHLLSELSGLSGYLSISFWLFAQIPQVIKNHTDKSVDGFSLGFLLCWFGGDFLNLISCLLNDAMIFQILLSSYYCIIDIILASQYYYYQNMYHNPDSKWYHHPTKKRHRHCHSPRTSLRDNLATYGSIDLQISEQNDPNRNRNTNSNLTTNTNTNTREVSRSHVKGIFKNQNKGLTKLVSSALLSGFTKVQGLPILTDSYDSLSFSTQEKENNSIIYKIIHYILTMDSYKLGRVLAWSCTALYLVSRIPQLYTNYKLKSTNGVSLKLICFALCGNFFYSMSLLLCESSTAGGDISKEFWESELSYFIGALGTVIFDCMVLIQWYHYDFKTKYRRTKSGKLKLISPKIDADNLHYSNNHLINSNTLKNIAINNHSNKIINKSSDPINFSESVKSTLSPNHMRKLSEFTPLSPMDFLLDDYMSTNTTNSNKSITNSKNIGYSQANSLNKQKKLVKASLNITPNDNNNNNNNNQGSSAAKKIGTTDEELNMSMEEDSD